MAKLGVILMEIKKSILNCFNNFDNSITILPILRNHSKINLIFEKNTGSKTRDIRFGKK